MNLQQKFSSNTFESCKFSSSELLNYSIKCVARKRYGKGNQKQKHTYSIEKSPIFGRWTDESAWSVMVTKIHWHFFILLLHFSLFHFLALFLFTHCFHYSSISSSSFHIFFFFSLNTINFRLKVFIRVCAKMR